MGKWTKADKVFITIAVLFTVWGAYFVYTKGYGPLNSLKKNKVYSTAVVTGETYILKGLKFYIYRYEVENKEYEGNARLYSNMAMPAGDSVQIVYDKMNPDFSMSVKDYFSCDYLKIVGFNQYTDTRHDKIRRHKKYHLILESYSDNAPVVNGVKVLIPGYTGGFCLDSCTTVMLEPQNGIWDLYISPNLKGLYYLPPNNDFYH